jgi:hypothetical protein
VREAKQAIRRQLRIDIGVGEPEANFVHSSDLEHAEREVNHWRLWIRPKYLFYTFLFLCLKDVMLA